MAATRKKAAKPANAAGGSADTKASSAKATVKETSSSTTKTDFAATKAKDTSTASSSKPKSSGRKVRISEVEDASTSNDASSTSGPGSVSNKKKAGASTESTPNGTVQTEGAGQGEGEVKHSPQHKDKKMQPEKSALKQKTSEPASNGKKRKAQAEAEAEIEEADPEGDDNEELDFVSGFESGSDDGEDSSDEEMEEDGADDSRPVNISELPQPAAKGKQAKGDGAGKKGKKEAKPKTGVVYLGRIPHGFHEEEMRSYFSQFGDVTRLRLSRNKKTGASKHYAFIEFEHASVAQIVSETMDNYLLHGHILQCKTVPPEQVHPKMWIGANRKYRPIPKGRIERMKHNAPKTEEQKEAIANRLIKRDSAKRAKLQELGIEYDFKGYERPSPAKLAADEKEEKKAVEAAKKLEGEVKRDAAAAEEKQKKKEEQQQKQPKAKKAKKSK